MRVDLHTASIEELFRKIEQTELEVVHQEGETYTLRHPISVTSHELEIINDEPRNVHAVFLSTDLETIQFIHDVFSV